MSPFRSKGQRVWKGRVYDRTGAEYTRTLGTEDEGEADEFCRFLARMRRQRRWDVLDLIVARALSVPDAFDHDARGTLTEEVARLRDLETAKAAADADTDLDPLVTEWATVARSPKYVRQVRRLIPAGARFPRSQFTRKRVSEFLATLQHASWQGRDLGRPVDAPTRNRYKAALMQFAKWLVEREVLDANPVRDVSGYPENDPRMVHYERADAVRLVKWHDDPRQRAIEALMAGTGSEWGAAVRVRAIDIRPEKREVYADGPKHKHGQAAKWRKRWVRFTEEWAWDAFWSYAKGFAGSVRIFDGVREVDVLTAHRAACAALELEDSTLHDWRHTYAILSLDDGIKPATVRRQLGHSPHSTVLERVYAAHLPKDDADYEKRTPRDQRGNRPAEVASGATTAKKRREVRA